MISNLERARGLTWLFRYPRLTAEQVRAFQDRRLRALVQHAYDRVPFYRALYDAHGVDPRAIRGVEDLHRLPTINRLMIQPLPLEQRLARGTNQSRLIVRKTSGSAGQPLTLVRTWIEDHTLGWLRLRAQFEMGCRPTHCQVCVLINHKLQKADVQLMPRRLLRRFGLLRGELIDCLQEPQKILDALRRANPDVIVGFPGVLAKVAALAKSQGGPLPQPRLIKCGGETITPLMRKQIESGFGAPLYDSYGSVEFNLIAWQGCQSGAMHTCDDGVILETLNGDSPAPVGGRGECVLTGLHSFAMPMIRYRLGDVVTRGPTGCACGSPFGTVTAVQGRMVDHFKLPGGRLVHPWEITTKTLSDPQVVREFQMLQESESRVLLRIVPQPATTAETVQAIRSEAELALGREVAFDIQLVDRIPLEITGKFRASRSLVESGYDQFSWEK
jgi:phenylacetate-CoA ligase